MFTGSPSPVAIPRQVHHSLLPHWLTHLGALGLFFIAVVDSSMIPLPLPGSTDLLLLWLVAHHGNPYLLAASAIAGSILGGYTSWSAGSKGGETALRKHVGSRIPVRISTWAENHLVLSVFLPALLPPPFPLWPFLVGSGAFGISRSHFLLTFSAARAIRYGLLTWLGVVYGRGVVRMFSDVLGKWSPLLIAIFAGVLVVAVCVWLRRLYNAKRKAAKTTSTNNAKPVTAEAAQTLSQ